jgi:hypothetical protein
MKLSEEETLFAKTHSELLMKEIVEKSNVIESLKEME